MTKLKFLNYYKHFFFDLEKFSDKETKFNTLPPLDRILLSLSIVPA